MADPVVHASFFDALRDLVAWLDEADAPGVIIGGVAASILGRPRATRDVDVLTILPADRWESFLAIGERFGFEGRIDDPLGFAARSHVLLLRHRPTSLQIDVSLGGLPFEEEAISRALRRDVGGVLLPLASPEDLLIMKAVAHRPRDVGDIEAILQVQQGLDLERVQRWLRAFSSALQRPEILEDFQAILRGRFR